MILINMIMLAFYIRDRDSAINLSTLILSYLSLFYVVSKGIEHYGSYEFEDLIFKNIAWILLISLAASPILTLLQWPNAPEYFPWDAFFTDNRFLLITGKNVGHSNAMWLMAFTAAFVMQLQWNRKRRLNFLDSFFIFLLFWGLFATKSRLALVFIGLLLMAWINYAKLFSKRIYASMIIISTPLFIFSIISPTLNLKTVELVRNIQNKFPSIRISASTERELPEESYVYSGRYWLNKMLIGTIKENPWFGVGHSDDRIQFGIDRNGFIVSDREDAAASSESGLRMWAKYGSIYYFALLLFIITPIFRAIKGYYRNNTFVISTCGIIFISGMGGTIFENLYGISGLFAMILIMFHIMRPYPNSKNITNNNLTLE